MSETLSQDPENLGSGYVLAPSYPPTPATPSSTVQDAPGSNLPPFSTFSSDMDATGGFGGDRSLFTDTRLLDISSWDYYGETRLLDRTDSGISVISSQPQYRPWESKPIDSTSQESLRHSFSSTTPISTFADAFATQNGVPKLPSFQSQFQSFNEPNVAVTTSEPTTLTTLTNLTPVSPNSSNPSTPLNSGSFHTLSAVNTRNYPLVPAPIQAREIPSIQQQFLDERHIQLFTHPTAGLTTLNNTIHSAAIFPPQNGAILQNNQLIAAPAVVTVLKSEPSSHMPPDHLKTGLPPGLQDSDLKLQNVGLHHSQFQNPMSTVLDHNGMYNGLDKKFNGLNAAAMDSPSRNDFRKKERRKIRASSLESSAESDGASSNMEVGSENSGQVASVSSTAGFKSHHVLSGNGMEADEISGGNADKQVKKKRKRCGECIGCQRKDNCGDCAPCRNDKSHQICKQRRCEKLTEKKLYGDDAFIRGDSRRGRGKGRGSGSYRGRKPSGPVSLPTSSVPEPISGGPPPSRPSPQPVHMLKPEQTQQQQQQQPMAPMPFYADPNRFSAPVWQTDPTQGWTQGQFIQQLPAPTQPTLEGYTQQYSNGLYQTTYQQPASFEANTFYTGAVQVIPRPPSASNQTQLSSRPNGSYSHTPSPVSSQQSQQNSQRSNISGQYQQDYPASNQSYAAPPTTPTGGVDSSQTTGVLSRPNSVNSVSSVPQGSQNFQPQHPGNFTPISSATFSPVSTNSNYVSSNINSANSGNAMPGYPPVSSHPPLASHNYSGGYPGNDMSGQNNHPIESPHDNNHGHHWSSSTDGNIWDTNVIQQNCNTDSAKLDQNEMQYSQNDNMQRYHQQSDNKTDSHHSQQQQQQQQPQQQLQQQQMSHNQGQSASDNQFSQADRVNLNSRIKTMILNKQQQQLENKLDEAQKLDQNKTGHFLLYSHHRRQLNIDDGGGFPRNYQECDTILKQQKKSTNQTSNNQNTQGLTKSNSLNEHHVKQMLSLKNTISKSESVSQNLFNNQQNFKNETIQPNTFQQPNIAKKTVSNIDGNIKTEVNEKTKTTIGVDIPPCNCLPPNEFYPEPGGYYTHLGCASSLPKLRKDFEDRTGVNGKALRVEKICYTGKEGKTPQGCPIAKWIIRRTNFEEKFLMIVKHRPGHTCHAAVIVVCIVAWDGLLQGDADKTYSLLCDKLNKFGLPTNRRCATNEPRTCACQGLNPETCGASFSFGCSWSMYYNGCKFARSKMVRKFRLSEKSEEEEIEKQMQNLATNLTPLYKVLAPNSFKNQCEQEDIASDCRLGLQQGRPFSGVTACVDFCAHAHKDSHNMNNGCTVVVSLTKHRGLSKAEDEQLHVLPLYVMDNTDEFGSKENQSNKITNGSIEVLNKYQCEVRVRDVPQPSCRRSGKKKKEETQEKAKKERKELQASPISSKFEVSQLKTPPNKQLQSNHVSSTVMDNTGFSPWGYSNNLYYNPHLRQPIDNVRSRLFNSPKSDDISVYGNNPYSLNKSPLEVDNLVNYKMFNNSISHTPLIQEQPSTALNYTYPPIHKDKLLNASRYETNLANFNLTQFNQDAAFINASHKEYKNTHSTNNLESAGIKSNFYSPDLQNPVMPLTNNSQGFIRNENNYFLNKYILDNSSRSLPSFQYIKKSNPYNFSDLPYYSKEPADSSTIFLQNPFDDSRLHSPLTNIKNEIYNPDYDYDNNHHSHWYSPPSYPSNFYPTTPPTPTNWHYQASPLWSSPEQPKPKVLGQVTEVIDNKECFNDSQVGGVAIALSHGSILFECAKHELHATTALKMPNRKSPTRISLVFYQHRNLNKAKHGWNEHEEKMRLKKLDSAKSLDDSKFELQEPVVLDRDSVQELMYRVPTMTTVSVTTKFPMYPCMVTGPYQKEVKCT